jgi:hypothetical protein
MRKPGLYGDGSQVALVVIVQRYMLISTIETPTKPQFSFISRPKGGLRVKLKNERRILTS